MFKYVFCNLNTLTYSMIFWGCYFSFFPVLLRYSWHMILVSVFTPVLSFQINDVHCEHMIEGLVSELGGVTPATRQGLVLEMISSALMALEIKRNQRLRCQEARAVCGMFWKVWGILKRTWDQSVRTEIEKVSQKRQGSERLDARKSQT